MSSMRHLIRLVTTETTESRAGLREYLDQTNYAALLTESQRIAFLVNTYGEKIGEKFERERDHIPAQVVQAVEAQPGNSIGEKVINWMMTVDPTTNREFEPTGNSQYTQWLVIRYLKNNFLLEDWPVAHEALALFHRRAVRNQLAKKDINAYATVHELRDAVRPFRPDSGDAQNMIKTMNFNDPALAQRMNQPDQVRVFYDGPDFKIVIPLTEPASLYWGRDTEWCTAWLPPRQNHFDNYNRYGPLYILFDKVKRQKLQFTFDHPTPQFMDKNDNEINLKAFLREHPNLVKVFGKRNWMKVANKIGLEFFTPDDLGEMPNKVLAPFIKTPDDFARLPEAKQNDPDFVARVATKAMSVVPDHLLLRPEVARVLDAEAEHDTPSRNVLVHLFSPTLWSDIVLIKALRDGEVSEEKFKALGVTRVSALLPDIIASNKRYWPMIDADLWRTPGLAKKLADIAALGTNTQSNNAGDALMQDFPASTWPGNVIMRAINAGQLSPLQFRQLSPEMQEQNGAHFLKKLAETNPEKLATIDDDLLPPKAIAHFLGDHPHAVSHLPPNILTDDALKAWIAQVGSGYTTNIHVLSYIPDARRTPEIEKAIDDRIDQLRGENRHYIPAKDKWDEHAEHHWISRFINGSVLNHTVASLPPRYRTPQFFEKAALHKMRTARGSANVRTSGDENFNSLRWWQNFLTKIPANDIRPELIESLKDFHDTTRRQQAVKSLMDILPKEKWTEDFALRAIEWGVVGRPDQLPDNLVHGKVAAKLWATNPTEYAELTRRASDSDVIKTVINASRHGYVSGASNNPYALAKSIPKDRLNEPMVHQLPWSSIKDIPPKLRSRRVLLGNVGHAASLTDVPAKWRDDEMYETAVRNRPEEIKHVPDALAWLKAHPDVMGKNVDRFENAGFTLSNGKVEAITDLPSTDLGDGCTAYEGMPEKREPRFFIMKGDRLYLRVNVKGKKARLDRQPDTSLAGPLRVLADKKLHDVDITELNVAGVYRKGDQLTTDAEEERKPFEGLEWSDTKHLKGRMLTAWRDGKPLAKFYIAPSGGYGGGFSRLQSVKWEAPIPTIVENNAAILAGYNKFGHWKIDNGTWEFARVGIMKNNSGLWIATQRKLGTVGDFTVYYAPKERYISIFDKDGMAANATLLKSGKLSARVNISYRYEEEKMKDEKAVIKRILDATQANLSKEKAA